MIPSDVASALRLQLPDQGKLAAAQPQNQPVVSAQRINDALSDMVPGQRLMAEIQALLPNGTYRAIVAQRDITLALPFSAKPGDTLELEVVETDGKVALAFVANRTAATGNPQESVPTTLSRTGQLIGDLLGGIDNQGKRAPPAPLNGSQPLVESMPKTAADLAPVLKQALTQSGMFYEAHQARWVAGELPTNQLLQEPQGQLSQARSTTAPAQTNPSAATAEQLTAPPMPATTAPNSPAELVYTRQATLGDTPTSNINAPGQDASRLQQTSQSAALPQQLTPLVQQQLDALATQTYAWQGQIWPGQQMSWEISEDQSKRQQGETGTSSQWQTRLKLDLPQLGGIEAALHLRPGGGVEISLAVAQDSSGNKLNAASQLLKQQFAAAGLSLAQFSVKHGVPSE